MGLYLAIGAFFLIIFYLISLSVTYNRKKGLTEEKKEYFRKLLRQVEKESNQKIVDYDKLYHKILLELGYKGDFGNILKTVPIVISDIDKIWELHKIRNKLVHDFDAISRYNLAKSEREYKEELEKLLK